ncbi:CHASE2 domain-containing protein [Methylomagnum sp.]
MVHLLRRLLPYLAGLAALSLFVLHTLGDVEIPLVNHLKRGYYDLRLSLTIPNRHDDRIVIADIDERSLAELGHWPWTRDRLAELVNVLFEHYQIRLLGFDVVFAERDNRSGWGLLERLAGEQLQGDPVFLETKEALRSSLQYDELFARALKDRPVVLGFVPLEDAAATADAGALPKPLLTGDDVPSVLHKLKVWQHFAGNLPELQAAAASGGFFLNHMLDADGVFRHLPLLTRHGDGVYESLSLAMLRVLENHPPVEMEISDDYGDAAKLEALRVGEHRIPTGEQSEVLIPYLGRKGSFSYLSIAQIMRREVAPDALRGRIVLVGTTAQGLVDTRTMPLESGYPGVEMHATVLAGMLDNSFKERPPWVVGLELLQLLGVGLAVIVLAPRLPAFWALLLAFALMGALLAGNFWLWREGGIAVDAVLPLLLLFLLYSNQMFFGFFLEGQKKRKLARLFGQYVPEELVAEMSLREDDFGIGGETRDMTVLFSDVRGFTTISEGLSSADLSKLMNEFLTPLTGVIHHHKGTIDKYMGDAIMAFWGAPLRDEQHAAHGVRAGLDMIRRVHELDPVFKAKGWPEVRVGVGLNTGPMSVGNMGSEFRMAYTVLGDAVNLGSRLESLTKQYGVGILISETTRAACPGLICREIDLVRVKGKHEPVAIFEPLDWGDEVTPETLGAVRRHERALGLYRSQVWNEAARLFGELSEADPDRLIYRIYLDRIATFRANPPPIEWDGVYTHTSK